MNKPSWFERCWGALLDATIVRSFDSRGYARHARAFDPADELVRLDGLRAVVTGANSGLGLATAAALARRGAQVVMTCRSESRGALARESLLSQGIDSDRLAVVGLDLADFPRISAVAQALARQGRVDILVHNAGLLPLQLERTICGMELTAAVHVAGPHILTRALLPALTLAPDARVITVSSGGMYTQRLRLGQWDWTSEPYDGVAAYAQTKRGQVILNELWQQHWGTGALQFHCMHPGWAATPGVEHSLPGFYKRMQAHLRSPEQGADTAVWLASSPALRGGPGGKFWFDRRCARTHYLPTTRERAADRQALWEWVEALRE